jgi:cystathionine beta-lyase family protein involved in aluminum resistance
MMLGVSGHPYDTLEEVIGLRDGSQTGSKVGSLLDWGINYKELELLYGDEALVENGENVAFDFQSIEKTLLSNPNIKLIHIQRF